MKFQIVSAALAATAAAAPNMRVIRQSNGTVPDGTPFNMLSIRPGSDLQYASFAATQGGLALKVKEQGATCLDGPDPEYATFYLSQGELNLYTPGNVTQKFYTDRSGMGQGVLRYTTSPGGEGASRNSETKGWAVDQYGDLTFAGVGLIACPSPFLGGYSVWVSAGVTNPAGASNCTGIAVRTSVSTEPIACTYSDRFLPPIQ